MSTDSIPPTRPSRHDLPQTEVENQKITEDFLAQLSKVLEASKGGFGGKMADKATEGLSKPAVKMAKSPATTSESENVKRKDSMKTRFLKAIISRDFPAAYRAVKRRVSLAKFQQWLAKTLPNIDPSFKFDKAFRTFVGEVYQEGSKKAGKSDLAFDIPEKHFSAGAKILAEVSDLHDKEKLYSAKYNVVNDIDKEIGALKKIKGSKTYQTFLNDLKNELQKQNPDPSAIKEVAGREENKHFVKVLFPVFSPTLTAGDFKKQFSTAVTGICDIIDEHFLDEEGLFREPGNVPIQGEVIAKLLAGQSESEVFESCKDQRQYCSALKTLVSQLKELESKGDIGAKDLEELKPAFERINTMILNIIDDSHQNKMEMSNIGLAAHDTCSFLDQILGTEYMAFTSK